MVWAGPLLLLLAISDHVRCEPVVVDSSRKNIDVSRDRWDRLVRLVEKGGLEENPSNSRVLDELEKGYRKQLRESESPKTPSLGQGGNNELAEAEGALSDMETRQESGFAPALGVTTPALPAPPGQDQGSQPTLLTWKQEMEERKENRRDAELEEHRFSREARTELMREFIRLKGRELELHTFHSRANPIPDYTPPVSFGLPEKPVSCSYCMSRDHFPAECPELAKANKNYPTRSA